MKPVKVKIEAPHGNYESLFDPHSFTIETHTTGIEDISCAYEQFPEYHDTGEREITMTGRIISEPERTLNRKALIV